MHLPHALAADLAAQHGTGLHAEADLNRLSGCRRRPRWWGRWTTARSFSTHDVSSTDA